MRSVAVQIYCPVYKEVTLCEKELIITAKELVWYSSVAAISLFWCKLLHAIQ